MEWREAALNRLLSSAWEKYAEALSAGKMLELEEKYETKFVSDVLDEVIDARVEDAAA